MFTNLRKSLQPSLDSTSSDSDAGLNTESASLQSASHPASLLPAPAPVSASHRPASLQSVPLPVLAKNPQQFPGVYFVGNPAIYQDCPLKKARLSLTTSNSLRSSVSFLLDLALEPDYTRAANLKPIDQLASTKSASSLSDPALEPFLLHIFKLHIHHSHSL